jgi:hypothetical protein
MALSPQYSWPEPDNSSLVKNGAQDIRALGDAIDTSVWNVGFGQAGKNKIINGNFGVWQRGTSFNTSGVYTADRWFIVIGSGAATVSQQSFTAGAAPVAGYESQYFMRYASANASDARIFQPIEDVRTFAGQTVTVSFWAKSATSDALSNVSFRQNFGSGGSAQVDTTSSSFTLTSSWARYSATLSIPSITGKTIGTNSNLRVTFDLKDSATFDFDIWGVQVEAGSKATPFQLAGGGDPQSELAMCQRYYWRSSSNTGTDYAWFATGMSKTTTTAGIWLPNPVPMRIGGTSLDFANLMISDLVNYNLAVSAVTLSNSIPLGSELLITNATGATALRPAVLRANNSSSAYVGVSAEY